MPRAACILVVVLAAALAAPQAALAHAALLGAAPSATGVALHAPGAVALTFSEPVDPRSTVISVTDAAARPLAAGPPRRSPDYPRLVTRAVRRTPRGWYLV